MQSTYDLCLQVYFSPFFLHLFIFNKMRLIWSHNLFIQTFYIKHLIMKTCYVLKESPRTKWRWSRIKKNISILIAPWLSSGASRGENWHLCTLWFSQGRVTFEGAKRPRPPRRVRGHVPPGKFSKISAKWGLFRLFLPHRWSFFWT